VEVEPAPQQIEEKAEQLEAADLVVGVLADLGQEGLDEVCSTLRTLSGSPRIAVLRDDQEASPTQPNSDVPGNPVSPYIVPWSQLRRDTAGLTIAGMTAAYQSVFAAGEKFGARGCCIIASKLETTGADWIRQIAQPLLEEDVDLVLPRYARHKYEGLLNSSIIAPLTRSLYGRRIHNPMGPDLGISRKLFQKILGNEGAKPAANRVHPLVSTTPAALCDNLQVCEVYLAPRVYAPTDWTNISSIVAQVLSPVFLEMERNAPCWQRTRASISVRAIGNPVFVTQDNGTVDTHRMVESFQLGNRDLQEIWGLVLPPSTLVELRRLSRSPLEQFRMPEELWVRIVYDFALAHRLRTINRDHLLRSMTPLYLAWVASYAHELETAGAGALEERLERISIAYESGKPYLVARWRWPDRFNS
jgi:glucosylglycerate synthase